MSTTTTDRMTTFQTDVLSTEYNGWSSYETWNVALWINNDYGFYSLARQCDDYSEFVSALCKGCVQTPDGVKWNDPKVNVIQINSDVFDF